MQKLHFALPLVLAGSLLACRAAPEAPAAHPAALSEASGLEEVSILAKGLE